MSDGLKLRFGYMESLENHDYYGFCNKCGTVSKNPAAYEICEVSLECPTCTHRIELSVIVDKDQDPPTWFIKMIEKHVRDKG